MRDIQRRKLVLSAMIIAIAFLVIPESALVLVGRLTILSKRLRSGNAQESIKGIG